MENGGSADTAALIGGCIQLLLPFVVLLVCYAIGNVLEKQHFASILEREKKYRKVPTVTFETIPADWSVASTGLAMGSVVVSVDYFKRFLASLRAIFGGRIKSYEPLLERARREAVLRMIEHARGNGYQAVINVRLETSRLASGRRDGKGTAGVEMLAYGTALKLGPSQP